MSKIKIFFSALAVVVGIGGAFASKSATTGTLDQLYHYIGPNTQLWGQAVLDQDENHYEPVSNDVCTEGNEICTYTKSGTTFSQSEKGTFTGQ